MVWCIMENVHEFFERILFNENRRMFNKNRKWKKKLLQLKNKKLYLHDELSHKITAQKPKNCIKMDMRYEI